jgi:hypothetical protein
MTEKAITATYRGKKGEHGYTRNHSYSFLKFRWYPNGIIVISRHDGSGVVSYANIISFFHNWKDITMKRTEDDTEG